MSATTQILLRAARDRVVDLLGLGESNPLQDVPVSADRLTVAINTTAKISIDPGQADVTYSLRDRNDKSVSSDNAGTGAATILVTPAITEDQTFRIFASKIDAFASGIKRQDYLTQVAEVKVGLDTTLNAFIDAPLLNPRTDSGASSNPRIVDYGSNVPVKVEQSQEGVDYSLVVILAGSETVVSQSEVRGNLGTVVVTSTPVQEDTQFKVRATKRFDPSEGRPTQTALLDVSLPLMVHANTGLAVSVQPSPTPYQKDATIVIAASQKTVSYRPYVHTLGDTEFVYGAPSAANLLPVGDDVQLPAPPWTISALNVPAGFALQGDYQPGTGAALNFTIPAVTEDCLVILEARKLHGSTNTPSSVQMQQAALVLVQPNPNPALALDAQVKGNALPGPLLVSGGQPGIFYYFRVGNAGTEITPPAYFHKVDANDPTTNKGLNQLRINLDFVLERDRSGATTGAPSATPPPPPLLDIGSQAFGISLFVRAMKARTRVSVPLPQTAQIPAPPVIKLDQDSVPSGTAAKIIVVASVKGENYQPFLSDETSVSAAQDGTGADLAFATSPLTQDTTFLVRVRQPGATGIPVTRTVSLTATVKPVTPGP
ncbi:MAG TPA: hypothetical protein VIH91_00775 [Terriglobales bacterium]